MEAKEAKFDRVVGKLGPTRAVIKLTCPVCNRAAWFEIAKLEGRHEFRCPACTARVFVGEDGAR